MTKGRKTQAANPPAARRGDKRRNADEPGRELERSSLTSGQRAVLAIFRSYLVNRGQMLCFNSAVLETYKVPLAELTHMGFLVVERFRGGYSLSDTGFAAMKNLANLP